MKCRNCDREAIYDDGLCEECHRRAGGDERVRVMSEEEKREFRGQTIDENGTVYDDAEKEKTVFDTIFQQRRQEEEPSPRHVLFQTFGLGRLTLKHKLMIGAVVAAILGILAGMVFLFVSVLPFILMIGVALFVVKLILSAMNK